jgi:hypothetical protein
LMPTVTDLLREVVLPFHAIWHNRDMTDISISDVPLSLLVRFINS